MQLTHGLSHCDAENRGTRRLRNAEIEYRFLLFGVSQLGRGPWVGRADGRGRTDGQTENLGNEHLIGFAASQH